MEKLSKYFYILKKYGCTDANIAFMLHQWSAEYRKYHTLNHLAEILDLIEHWLATRSTAVKINDVGEKIFAVKKDELQYEAYVLCAFFHDVVLYPWEKDNEEKSAFLFDEMCNIADAEFKKTVYDMILDTKDHTKQPSSDWSRNFLFFDLHGLTFGSLPRMISDEKLIFREFGFVDFGTYKVNRAKLLRKFEPMIKKTFPPSRISEYIDWCENVNSPRIAVYPGTFFPFHKGHQNILEKAERMFDKVIILVGFNPAKSNNEMERKNYVDKIKRQFPNNQVDMFDGMLHNYVSSLPYPVTLVKGLRNEDDFKTSKLEQRFMEDYRKDIDIAYILGDRKYENVSSSAIKTLTAFKEDTSEYIVNTLKI